MAADDRAAGKSFQSFFQGAKRVHVEVVGRLVEDDQVRTFFQHASQVHAVAFPARQVLDLLLLIGPGEVEAGAVAASIDLGLAQHDRVLSLGNDFIHRLVGIERTVLIDVAELHCFADPDCSAVRLLLADDHAEHGGLACTVGTDDADDAALRQAEFDIFIEYVVAECLADALGLDHQIPEPRSGRNIDFQIGGQLVLLLIDQFLIPVETRLALRLPGLRRHTNPFQLMLECFLALGFGLLFLLQPILLLFEPRRVVALEGNAGAAIEFQNPARHVVEKIAVVRHGDDRALVLLQVLLQPLHGFGIEVIGRLVEQQNVRLLDHEAAEGHAALFTAGEHADLLIGGGTAQRIHGDFEFALQFPAVGRFDLFLQLRLLVDEFFHLIGAGLAHAVADRFILMQQRYQLFLPFFDDLFDRLVGIELRLLFEQSDAVAFRASDLTDIIGIGSGNNLEQ